jgi:hypothetical protein
MECRVCKRRMVVLFLSATCEHCENGPTGKIHVGYTVWPDGQNASIRNLAVFRDENDAENWRAHHIHMHMDKRVRAVGSLEAFCWVSFEHPILGAIHFAIGTFEVYLDHRYEPLSFRAFLLPE